MTKIYIIENQDGCDMYEDLECCTDVRYVGAEIKTFRTLDYTPLYTCLLCESAPI